MLLETAAYNEEILVKAKGIRATRELSIINEEFGFIDRTRKHADFLAYFEAVSKTRYQKWEIVYKHFKNFCNGHCRCKDGTVGLCNEFKEYLLNLKVKLRKGAPIARNSAAGYWSTFRALLKQAHKEGWLKENLNDHLDYIEWEEPKINFLEIEEVKRLVETPCKPEVLKRASLFAVLTGLRISDILALQCFQRHRHLHRQQVAHPPVGKKYPDLCRGRRPQEARRRQFPLAEIGSGAKLFNETAQKFRMNCHKKVQQNTTK